MSISVRRQLLFSGLVAMAVAAVSAVVVPITVLPASPASAHGNVTGPASRNFGCWDRWGDRWQAPEMATEDPMCHQAWQANPNAMWNWNGLFREGVAGNHQAAIPDGQLCSAGRTEGGRYAAMDAIGNWHATPVGNNFTLRLHDGASHGADYIWVYVSRPGYDPITQPLRWADLQRVAEVGDTPASEWDRGSDGLSGVQIDIPVSVSGRSGRAVVYTIWQASHLDQSYYFCSDVNFGGTSPTTPPATTPPATTPPATTPPATTPPATTPPATTPPATTPPATGGCTATYTPGSQWQGGFQGEVKVTAGSSAIHGWTVTITFANGQRISQAWNAEISSSGSTTTARNVSWNGALGAGASTSFGFLGSWTGTNSPPALSCSATH